MMSISNKVTIVIPTKNRPEEVINCLKSVLAQSILPQEIVIVDGGGINQYGFLNNSIILA